MEDKDYKILSVVPQQAFTGKYGTLQPYNLTLEGLEGTVQLSQKPETAAPQVGQTIFGHVYERNGYKNFKRVSKNFQPKQGGDDYMIRLLEAIAIAVGANQAVKDNVPTEVKDEPIDLSKIPF